MKPTVTLPAIAATLLLAACATPASPPGAQEVQSTPTRGVQAAAAVPAGNGERARTCTVSGFRWVSSSTRINPTMTVSSDGYCSYSVATNNSAVIDMTAVTQPTHGRLTTSGGAMRPYLRYTPTPGYEGPDSFSVTTGLGGSVTAEMAVTVVK